MEDHRKVKKIIATTTHTPSPSLTELKEAYGRSKFYPNLRCVPGSILATVERAGIIPTSVLRPDEVMKAAAAYSSTSFSPSSLITYPSSSYVDEEDCTEFNDIFFVVGVDAVHGELTDCGGRRMRGERIEETAIRELYEESAQLFDFRSSEWKRVISNFSPVVTDGNMCIFFVSVRPPTLYGFPTALPIDFGNNRASLSGFSDRIENSTLYWIPYKELALLSATRTRKRLPKKGGAFHNSSVEGFLVPTIASNGMTTAVGKQRHPLIYEAVRRVLFPTLPDLSSHIILFKNWEKM